MDPLEKSPSFVLPSQQFSVRTPEERQRDADLQWQLDTNRKNGADIYAQHPEPQPDGLALKFGGTAIPLANGIDIWDLRQQPFGDNKDLPNYSERYEPKGQKFGLSWHKSF